MSLGFGVGDFVNVGQLCWKIYKTCKDSSEDFKNLSSEVGSLHNVLQETEELLSQQKLSPTQQARLEVLTKGSENVLKDLEGLLVRYGSLGTNSQRAWDRMGFGIQDMTALRLRLISQTTLLDAFNNASSHARLERKLNLLIAEIRAGKREGSVISSRTFNSVADNDRETWRQLRRELKDIGISPAILTEKRQFILKWFQEAIAAGGLEESHQDNDAEGDISENDSDTVFYKEAESLSLSQPPTSIQLMNDQTGVHQPAEQLGASSLLKQTSKKKSRMPLSNLLHVLLRRDDQLISAAEVGDLPSVKKLLEKGADLESEKFGRTALRNAAERGHVAVVRELLEKGANMESKDDYYGHTALHRAAQQGHRAVVRLLLEKGANINSKDSYEITPLHFGAENGHEAVVRLLLEKGADIDSKDNYYGQTALHSAARKGHVTVVRLLLENRANIDSKDKLGVTAMHRAALKGNEAMVRMLLEKGADVDSKDSHGVTALHHAALHGHEAAVRLLLEKGADTKLKDNYYGRTAPQWAAQGGHEVLVRLLQSE